MSGPCNSASKEPMTEEQWEKMTPYVRRARHEMIRLEGLCRVEMGDAAFAEFEHALAARVERTIRPDDTNVVKLQGQ